MNSESLRTNDSAEHILSKYSDTVFRVAYSRTNNTQDAEDIMQDVFVRYMRAKPVFESEEHEKAWFIRVAINCSKSLLCSPWFTRTAKLEDTLSVTLSQKSEVYYAVMALPKDMRTAIHLYYYENYSIKETAGLLGRSESYVKSVLARARKKLKEKLEIDNV